ncbi:MAG: tRNA epoxyqueuosine(34) reductase QueG [Hyphomicrobiales bacterium]|nr:tRNA epoxyqueuosine(34) reductase QueG [Hyphomicrobiales bacterium]
MDLISALRADAAALGFDVCRVLSVADAPDLTLRLDSWLAEGAQGDMDWMRATADRRAHPRALWPGVRSIIMLGMNYGPLSEPLVDIARPTMGNISVYARHRDYHDVVKGRLKTLASRLVAHGGGDVKVFVDTAPVMEKPLAMQAGLGWQGKHTNLVSRNFGSWLFLGSIFSTLALATDQPETDHCGQCRACIDICPTEAIVAPYRLDARRCISYLTIEHKGHIPARFREKIGNRVYGCDDCLAVCPWNKFAQRTREQKLAARADMLAPDLEMLAAMNDADFRGFFSGSPVKRIGHARFLRNVLIAIGNSADRALARAAEARLAHESPLVRAAAVWALSRLLDVAQFADHAARRRDEEADPDVRREWEQPAAHEVGT